jgi:hypothetical protein
MTQTPARADKILIVDDDARRRVSRFFRPKMAKP